MSVKDKYGTEVHVTKFDVNWLEIKNLCRGTIGMGDSKKEPTQEWKRNLLVAEHSPLRHSLITVEIDNIPYALMGHLVRHHEGVTPYVRTSRTDRTGVDRQTRSQMDVVDMRMDLNIQSVINISRKRLCSQADADTREIWQLVVEEIGKLDPDIAWACVPEGIHTCGCTEAFGDCKMCNNFLDGLTKEQLLDLQQRISEYQENFAPKLRRK